MCTNRKRAQADLERREPIERARKLGLRSGAVARGEGWIRKEDEPLKFIAGNWSGPSIVVSSIERGRVRADEVK